MAYLDESIIAEVRDTLGDEMFTSFAKRMLAEAGETVGHMRAALAEGGTERLAQIAHRCAGSAVSVGAVDLHARLKAIEDAARSGVAVATLSGLIDVVPGSVDATRRAMEALVGPI